MVTTSTESPTVRVGGSPPDGMSSDLTGRPRGRPFAVAGSTYGRYRVVDELGAGGAGVVLRAEDPQLGREVAIKVLRRGVAAHGVWTRSAQRQAREAQALAKLSHPNTVRVFDVGMGDDALWIAMELVDGGNVAEWLKETPRSVAEIVAVFVAAGRGLVAAHDVGIVHRDFKPSNILLGADGRTRVADFGLARGEGMAVPRLEVRDSTDAATGEDPGIDDEDLSRTGVVMGTPGYMAPEQLRSEVVDTRTDQFAFCVSLYRALYDELPFPRNKIPTGRPSFEPGPHRNVPRWLRAVLVRGLESRPDDRWPDMRTLLRRLERGGARWQYAAAVGAVGAAVAAAIALVPAEEEAEPCVGGALRWSDTWDARRSAEIHDTLTRSDLPYAERTAARVVAHLDGLARMWQTEYRDACEAGAAGRIEPRELDARMVCLDRVRDRTAALVQVLAEADADVAAHAAEAVSDLPLPERCEDAVAGGYATTTDGPAIKEVRAMLARARALERSGRYADALAVATQAVDAAKGTADEGLQAAANVRLGSVQTMQQAYPAAAKHLEAGAWAATSTQRHDVMAEAARLLVQVLGAGGLARLDEAATWAERAREALAQLGNDPLERAALDLALARLASDRGRYKEAEAAARRAVDTYAEGLPADDPRNATAAHGLAHALGLLGRYEEAVEQQQRALDIRREALGPEHPAVAEALADLAGTMGEAGKPAEGLPLVDEAVALGRRVLPPQSPTLGALLDNRANLRLQLGDATGALADREEHRDIVRAHFGEAHPRTLMANVGVGACRAENGEFEVAERIARDTLPGLQHALGPEHPYVTRALVLLSTAVARQYRQDEAFELQEQILAQLEHTMGPDHPDVAGALNNLGVVSYRRKDFEAARRHHERALAIRRAVFDEDNPDVGSSMCNLAWALAALGRHEEARGLYERGIEISRRALGNDHPRLTYSLTGFGLSLATLGELDAAIDTLDEALRIGQQVPERAVFKNDTRFSLAQMLWERDAKGDRSRARKLAAKARDGARGEKDEMAGEIEAWLAAHP